MEHFNLLYNDVKQQKGSKPEIEGFEIEEKGSGAILAHRGSFVSGIKCQGFKKS